MATKKAGGTSKNGRDSNSKSLGLKVNSLKKINDRNILVLGNKLGFTPGIGVTYSKNYNLISSRKGVVKFLNDKRLDKKFILII